MDAQLLPLARLQHWADTTPQSVFLVQPLGGGRYRHYSWLDARKVVGQIAGHLRSLGWPPGSCIAILGKNSAEWILADLGIWAAGHVSVPLYPAQTQQEINRVLAQCDARGCFVGELDDASILASIDPTVQRILLPGAPAAEGLQWDHIIAEVASLSSLPARRGDELATLVYTSGTSGNPKGVMHTFDTLTASVLAGQAVVGWRRNDRYLSYLPLAHIMERQVGEFGALQIGFRLFFVESLATFSRDLQHARPTVFVSVPRLWEKFRQGVLDKISPEKLNRLLALPLIDTFVRRKIRKGLGLDAARALYNGGAALPTDIGAWFARVGSPILEGYGMTELGGATHLNPKGRNVFGSAGIPFPGVEQRIDSQTGELQVRSAANTPGYYRSPECEAELFTEDGWLRTGDKAYLDNEQRAYIVGRLKDNFKSSKGKFVTPAPIEMALGRHPACENCVVVGSGLPQPWGVMVLNETATLGLPQDRERLACSLEEHLTQVNKSLAPHERLDGIAVSACVWSIGNGLLTPTLKTRRKLVEERYLPVVSQFVGQQPRIHWID